MQPPFIKSFALHFLPALSLPISKKQSSSLSLKISTLIICLPPTTDPSLTSQSTLRSLNVLSPPNLSHTLQPIKSPTSFRVPPHKSTESALTLITFDLLSGLNNNRGSILVLLYISSAFDTLDHNVLIHRLSTIGIYGITFNWFTSYISNCSSTVRFNSHSSPPRSITHGVPQVSIFGPLLFNIYLLPIFQIFTDYPDISLHTYTDDLNSTSTAPNPPYMPPTDSPLVSTPYTNGLLPTPLNLTPPKPMLFFSTYPYIPPPSLNHPHLTKHDYPPLF